MDERRENNIDPRRLLSVCVAALIALASARSVLAAPPVAATEAASAELEAARADVAEGRRLYAQRRFEAALERFTAAYARVRAPTVGLEVARAQMALGDWVHALTTAREVIASPVQPGEPDVFGSARARATELASELNERLPQLALEVTPRAAVPSVTINGKPLAEPRRKMVLQMNPGRYRLEVGAPGYYPDARTVTLEARQRAAVAVALVEDPRSVAAPSPAPVAEGREDTAAAEAARRRGYVAFAVAGAAALAGTVTGILAFQKTPQCPDDYCSADQRDEADAAKTLGYIATGSFGVALVAGAYGLWQVLSRHELEPDATPTLVGQPRGLQPELVPTRSGAILRLHVRF